jgi:pimeloyl-ACP methyl ester carboxylesterase
MKPSFKNVTTLLVSFIVFQLTVCAQLKIKRTIVEGQGIPIVLLPGGTVDISAFNAAVKELGTGYMVIRMENFNVQFAMSDLTLPKDYSVRHESQAIGFTLDSLQIKEPVVLLGHSYGGLIALDFALNHPGRIRALVLLEPPVFGIADVHNESPRGMKAMLELTRELTTDAVITEQIVERFRCELLNCDSLPVRQHPQWSTWLKQKNRLRGLAVVGRYKPDMQKLRAFPKPVLVITGSNTATFHKRIDELLAKEFAVAKAVQVQSGHAIPSTAAQEMVRRVKEFLELLL